MGDLKSEAKAEINRVNDDLKDFLEMLKQAVDLAATQVTDQRIAIMEKALGKTSSYGLSDFFVDLLIATAATPLAALVLRATTKFFIEKVLNTRQYYLYQGKEGWWEFAKPMQLIGKPESFPYKLEYTEILKPGSKNYDLWKITESVIQPVTTTAMKAAKEIIKDSWKPKFTTGTSPSVMFKDAVFTFVDKQGGANKKITNDELTKIDNNEFTDDALKEVRDKWKSKANITSGPEHRQSLRLKYAKNFEALIWVLLCGGYKNMVWNLKQGVSYSYYRNQYHGQIITPEKPVDVWKIDPALVVYWVNNLPHPDGDGEMTFRERAFYNYIGVPQVPAGTPHLELSEESETKAVKSIYQQINDTAQIDLKHYFTKLSENTEVLLADPAKIIEKKK